ncbi:hypothetical protein SDC9_140069 [bioreactor metagenome]|uniref:Uncharacterized protein n=1 Tax=bioreactor metagenome TaxID=1076179 RepID=A0A645DWE5_9ZZZZ
MNHLSPTINDPFDYTDRIATTKWVHNHEWSSNIDRWRTVFDYTNEELDWGFKAGIRGGEMLKPAKLRSAYVKGHRIRFFVSFKGMNTVCMTGEFLDDRRMLCGTVLYDGKVVVSVSVDIDVKDGSMAVRGYEMTTGKDVSKSCDLLKIQVSW